MFSLSGPIPLLAIAILLSVAIFFAYRDVAALKAKVQQLETSLPGMVQTAVASSLRQSPGPAAFPFMDYGEIAEDLPDFAEVAAQAISEELRQTAGAGAGAGPSAVLEDVTEDPPAQPQPQAPAAPEDSVPTVVAKRRGPPKKVVAAE